MIARPVLLKVLGFTSAGLALALAASGVFGWVQTERLGAAKLAIQARDLVIETLNQRIADDRELIAGRDQLIEMQNAAVDRLRLASEENRKAYQARLAQAETKAATYRSQADDIMSRHIETQDELERSREALRLILETVGEETQ